jgi:hypothetical protein
MSPAEKIQLSFEAACPRGDRTLVQHHTIRQS